MSTSVKYCLDATLILIVALPPKRNKRQEIIAIAIRIILAIAIISY